MNMKPGLTSLCLLVVASGSTSVLAAPFDGAEGYGAMATGGRGGTVVKVTTLDASGPGSLQAALDVPGPRTIVFDVSGVITADELVIPHGQVTIAGQTAPGAGITIDGRLSAAYEFGIDDIVIQHLRIRPTAPQGPGEQIDALQLSRCSRVLLDHVSVSFGVDESIDLYEATDVTVQWSTIESAATEGHPEGVHNYGLINGPDGARASVHHNLFAHNQNRNPALATGPTEVRNNVVYNVRHGFVHHNPADGHFAIVGNWYRRGADDDLFPFFFDDENGGASPDLQYYLADNMVDDPGIFEGVVDNPWTEPFVHPSFEYLGLPESYRVDADIDWAGLDPDYVPVTQDDSATAYDRVLACAGAWPRDTVTLRSVQDTIDRTGSWGANVPPDLMEGLTPGTPEPDGDGDGMPDAWEDAHGLDASDGSDHAAVQPSGYTAMEEYLAAQSLAIMDEACGGEGPGGDTDGGSDSDGGVDSSGGGGPGGSVDTGDGPTPQTDGGGGTGPSATGSVTEGQSEGGGSGCSCRAPDETPPLAALWLLLPCLGVARPRRRAT